MDKTQSENICHSVPRHGIQKTKKKTNRSFSFLLLGSRMKLRDDEMSMSSSSKYYLRFFVYCLLFTVYLLPLIVTAADYSLDNVDPLKRHGGGNPVDLAVFVINYAMGFLGAIIFGVFIYGGVTILFSRGNSKLVEKGKKTLLYATMGIVAIFFSYAALNLIFTILEDIKK